MRPSPLDVRRACLEPLQGLARERHVPESGPLVQSPGSEQHGRKASGVTSPLVVASTAPLRAFGEFWREGQAGPGPLWYAPPEIVVRVRTFELGRVPGNGEVLGGVSYSQ